MDDRTEGCSGVGGVDSPKFFLLVLKPYIYYLLLLFTFRQNSAIIKLIANPMASQPQQQLTAKKQQGQLPAHLHETPFAMILLLQLLTDLKLYRVANNLFQLQEYPPADCAEDWRYRAGV